MKKIVMLLAGVVAATAFAPEASALPVFARQLGRACSACHFQHFPALNSFGRDFKASGFTLMGSQGKIKDEHLSIPNTLNLGVLTTTRYDNVSYSAGTAPALVPTKWQVPGSGGELSIFFGGRISDFAGFLSELAMPGAATVGSAKLAMLFPVGDYRVGPVIFSNSGQGVAHSFELLNTGAANTHKISAYGGFGGSGSTGTAGTHVAATSAAQFFGTNTAATGVSLVAVNTNMGFINIAKYEAAPVGTAGAGSLPLTYARVAGLFGLGSWDLGVGLQSWSGTTVALGAGANVDHKATVIDAQLQGELSGMPFGLYASYGRAPAVTGTALTNGNAFNSVVLGATSAASSFNITAELGVIPRGTVQLALRSAKVGGNATITGVNDNAIMIGATYELAQNVELSLTHTSNSGSAWDGTATAAHTSLFGPPTTPNGKNETNFMLEALF